MKMETTISSEKSVDFSVGYRALYPRRYNKFKFRMVDYVESGKGGAVVGRGARIGSLSEPIGGRRTMKGTGAIKRAVFQ
jgi:hypothetical protein